MYLHKIRKKLGGMTRLTMARELGISRYMLDQYETGQISSHEMRQKIKDFIKKNDLEIELSEIEIEMPFRKQLLAIQNKIDFAYNEIRDCKKKLRDLLDD